MSGEITNQSGKGDKRIFQTLTFLFLRTPNFFQELLFFSFDSYLY